MILVNNPGDWGKTFAPLLHAEWHGWTVTDLVFPFFLFVMGVAIPLAFSNRLERSGGDPAGLHRQIIRRAIILFGLGLLMNWAPFFDLDWSKARIPGVLQRIAVVYCLASLAYLHLRTRGRAWLTAGLLCGYWIALKLVPVPGFGAGDLSPQGNLAGFIDGAVLGSHTWSEAPGRGDPEGILSTLPALATALIGILSGELLRSSRQPREKLYWLLIAACVGISGGLLMATWLPINKNLWTSSYVVFTAGIALALLGGIYLLVDIKGWDRWARPFLVFGLNSIAAFVGSGLLARVLLKTRWESADGSAVSLHRWLYETCVVPLFPDYWASLAWAIANVMVWLCVAGFLYRRRILIKI
jgi:predicted acyltransferase